MLHLLTEPIRAWHEWGAELKKLFMRVLTAIFAFVLAGIPALACDRVEAFPTSSIQSLQPSDAFATSQFDASAAQEILRLVNGARAQARQPALAMDGNLNLAAQIHVLELKQHGSLSHQFPGELALSSRLTESELHFDRAGENVALDYSAPHAHQTLMASDEHRQNLLNADFNVVGIAVVWDRCQMYVVQDFARRVPSYDARRVEDIVAEKVATLRNQTQLPHLTRLQAARLTDAACNMDKAGDLRGGAVPAPNARYVVNYSNSQPTVLPVSASKVIGDGQMRNFSVGACYGRSEKHPSGTYFVTMLFY